MHLVQIWSAEFYAQPTGARRGPRCCPKMKTLAGLMSFSIRIIRTSYSRHFGRRDDNRGSFTVADLAADFTDRRIMALRGSGSRARVFPVEFWAGSALPFRERTLVACMQSSRRRTAVSTAPMTLGNIGHE